MDMISSFANLATANHAARNSDAISMKLLKQSLDTFKQNGENMVSLLQSASMQPPAFHAPNEIGALMDYYA